MRGHFLRFGLMVCGLAVILQAQTPIAPRAPFTAQDVERGRQLLARGTEFRGRTTNRGSGEPFKILGNLYSVGIPIGGVFMLTSPQGHILIGAGQGDNAEAVEKNIQALGFKMTDVQVIAIPHWHGDNAGGGGGLSQE